MYIHHILLYSPSQLSMSRCVWAGAIIAGQFLLYEVCKGVFQITADDLSLFLDVIGSIELGSGMAGLRN